LKKVVLNNIELVLVYYQVVLIAEIYCIFAFIRLITCASVDHLKKLLRRSVYVWYKKAHTRDAYLLHPF